MVSVDSKTGLRLTRTLQGYVVNTVSGYSRANGSAYWPRPGVFVGVVKKVGTAWHGFPANTDKVYHYPTRRAALDALAWRHDKAMEGA